MLPASGVSLSVTYGSLTGSVTTATALAHLQTETTSCESVNEVVVRGIFRVVFCFLCCPRHPNTSSGSVFDRYVFGVQSYLLRRCWVLWRLVFLGGLFFFTKEFVMFIGYNEQDWVNQMVNLQNSTAF